MCGLVGVINKSFNYRLDFDKYFKQALICDSVRGDHSTGALMVTSNYDEILVKRAVDPMVFLDDQDFIKSMAKSNRVMMGHNRYATKGAVGDDTAHPFNHGPITLCHNGTLYSHRTLTHRSDFDVDSEAICYMLSISTDIVKDLERLDGAFALTWYNSDSRTFHVARNKERKLYMAKVKETQGLGSYLYASEVGMLMWLAGRNGIVIDTPFLVPEGEILTFKVNGKDDGFTSTPFVPMEYYDYYSKGGRVVHYSNKTKVVTTPAVVNTPPRLPDPLNLVGKVVDVCFYQWISYEAGRNKYGYCLGMYGDDITVTLGSVSQEASLGLLKAADVKVKIVSVKEADHYYANYYIEEGSTRDKLEKVFEEMGKEVDITPKKKEKIGVCANCDATLTESNIFIAWNSSVYCQDCADMHPESIY